MHGRSAFSAIRACAIALALGLVQLTAHAVTWKSNTDFLWNAATGKITAFPGEGSGNMWAAGTKAPTATGPEWTGPQKRLPFNPSPTLNFKAKFSAAGIAKSLMRPAAAFAIPIIAQSALSYLLDQACVRIAGGTMEIAEGALWEECHFTQMPKPATLRFYNGYRTPSFFDTRALACGSNTVVDRPGYAFWCRDSGNNVVWSGYDVWQCKDASGAWKTVANRTSETGPNCAEMDTVKDGWQPTDQTAAEAKITSILDQWTQADFLYGFDPGNHDTGGVLDNIINSGNGVDVDSVSASGEASKQGTPETTTKQNPDGSTDTITKTTTNNYNYEGSSCTGSGACTVTVTVNQTTTTTTTNNQSSNTTTTTETKTPDPSEDCKDNPDKLGCVKLGEPKADDQLSKDSKAWTFEPVSFGGGSCPAPVAFTAFGHSYTFSYGPLCDKLAMLAPLFLALATLAAAYIIADGFKVQ